MPRNLRELDRKPRGEKTPFEHAPLFNTKYQVVQIPKPKIKESRRQLRDLASAQFMREKWEA